MEDAQRTTAEEAAASKIQAAFRARQLWRSNFAAVALAGRVKLHQKVTSPEVAKETEQQKAGTKRGDGSVAIGG